MKRKARRQVINMTMTNERGDNATDFMGIKWIIGNSMKIFMSIKPTILLKWTNPLKDANYHEEIGMMNSLVCVKEVIFIVKMLLTKNTPNPYAFTNKFPNI